MTEPEAKPEAAPVPQPVPAPPHVAPVVASDNKPPYSVQELLILIAAIGVVVVNVVTVYTAAQTMEKVDAVKQEAVRSDAATDKKLDVIHEQTNSNLTSVKSELERATGEIELLKRLLVEEKLEETKPEEKPEMETEP